MKRLRKTVACLLAAAMLLPMAAQAAWAETSVPVITGSPEEGFTLTDEKGNQASADENWKEEYPYGLLALEYSQLTVTEGGSEMTMKVYRLGDTAGKITAVLRYMPTITRNEDGSLNYASAISAEDLVIAVEDPLPIAAYQPWGEDPAPEAGGVGLRAENGVDGEGLACVLLSPDLETAADEYQWYARALESDSADDWEEIVLAEGEDASVLPVGQEELEAYDFRCVYTVDGVRYSTDAYSGEAWVKPAEEELPEAPADLERNPEPTFTTLDLTQGDAYDGMLFEVTFAEGEYEKEIRVAAVDDAEAETDEFGTLTIMDSVGGDVLGSMNTMMLRVADNDQAAAEPAQVGFVQSAVSADKSDGSVQLTVRRTGGTTQPLTVDWALEAGEAQPGTDYADASGTLYFYADQTEQTIEIQLINDQVENLAEKDFTVRLSNLRGDDASSIDPAGEICTVGVYNSNTAQELNLVSALSDVEAVDVSGGLTEADPAPMEAGEITGSQVPRGSEGTGTVEWNLPSSGGISLMSWSYNGGSPITFTGGGWNSTVTYSQSLTSKGNNSKTQDVENMCELYSYFSTRATGGAGLASGWDRLWYGDKEYAWTYFEVRGDDPTFYGDVNPQYSKSGLKVYLNWHSNFNVSGSLDYNDGYDELVLGTKTYESRSAEDNISSSATTTLTRRTFSNDFYLTVYTANDANSGISGAAVYDEENYDSIIGRISITEGGTNGGRLYEGSTVQIQLGETHLECTEAYLSNSKGEHVVNATFNDDRSAAIFSNLIQPPDDTYTFHLVLERRQDIKLDLSTSSEVDDSGVPLEGAIDAAYDLLIAKNTQGGEITVGYTPTEGLTGTPEVKEQNISLDEDWLDDNGMLTISYYNSNTPNIQWINFNLTEDDLIVVNGKSYRGNEPIWLETSDINANSLQFYFYEEEFLTVERPMKATLDAVALYYDSNGDGQINGHYDRSLGTFVLDKGSGDIFVTWLEGDYQETDFQPVVDGDGTVHQYFMRPYYTANAVAITIPEGHSIDEKMQVMPSFITDVTNSAAYEALTDEQKAYRTIVSGKTEIRDGSNTWTGYSADDHMKYTAEATVYSYVDIPLGGDKSPAAAMTNKDLDANAPKNGTYTKDDVTYQILDGLVYYYDADAPSQLGNAVYVWEPEYEGNLLYDFDDPAPITIAKSIAGDNTPIAGTDGLETRYRLSNGSWTTTAPAGDGTEYAKTALGTYITETRANTAGAEKLNAYLGAFGGNDTFALTVQEQNQTTGQIRGEDQRALVLFAAGDEENDSQNGESKTETVTRGTVGSFPNSDYLKQNSGTGGTGSASSSGHGAYEEFSVDAQPEIYSFSSEALGMLGVETDGQEVSFSFGLPVHSKDFGGQTGSAVDTFTDVNETGKKIKDFISAIRNKQGNPFSHLTGTGNDNQLGANNLKSKSVEFSVSVAFALSFKYNPLDNSFQFSEGALSASVGIELRLQYRFTPVPILYIYAQFSAEASVQTGLGQNRVAVLADEPILRNAEVQLTEVGTGSGESQYYFTTDKKGFQLTFNGKVYMEAYTFTDNDEEGEPGHGEYSEGDDLGDQLEGFTPGYLSSDGSEPTEVILVTQDGFDLPKKTVVVLTVMDDGDPDVTASATLTDLSLIEDVDQDLYWSGLILRIEGAIELGLGVGIDIAKAEIYAKASVGIAMTWGGGVGSDEGGNAYTFDSFELGLGLGFRVVFLFFNYEQDLISYSLEYDGETDKWSQSWSALGGEAGGDLPEPGTRSALLTLNGAGGGTVQARITPPTAARAQVYDNGVSGRASISTFAFTPDDENVPFEVSGYGTSVNAFMLMEGVSTGYDYQIVTVGDDNYVVYTGTRDGKEGTVDATRLWLSRLEVTQKTGEEEDTYGLVNPVDPTSRQNYILVDVDAAGNDDGTGDLDFHAWADADGKIHVLWVSYASKSQDVSTPPSGSPYTDPDGTPMNEENYDEVKEPEEPDVERPTDPAPTEPTEPDIEDYYISAVGYEALSDAEKAAYVSIPDAQGNHVAIAYQSSPGQAYTAYQTAQSEYTAAKEAYDAYQDAVQEYEEYDAALALYKAWYNYYAGQDVQNQVTSASRNTVVKYAAFDTTDPDAAGFTEAEQVSAVGNAYYFLPQNAGDVAVYAQSVPYSDTELAARLKEYEDYLDVLYAEEYAGVTDTANYLKTSKTFRMNYQESLLSVYGGNSRLTITGTDGEEYEDGTMTVSQHQSDLQNPTNEILTNLAVAEIDNAYYLAYVTQQDYFEADSSDLVSISRLYLRTFSIVDNEEAAAGDPAQKVVWGDPYLLRTVLNGERDSSNDGVYANGALPGANDPSDQYTDAYLANLSFLTAKLGDKLSDNTAAEDFTTFSLTAQNDEVEEETFLLFEMNGSTYVIQEASLKSITGSTHKGTIHPFFTPKQIYGDTQGAANLSSGKSEVVIGADGDGNVAAVYTASVPNTVNNAIYISYWDPYAESWSAGVMLAMNHMSVYERSVAQGWDAQTTEAAYFEEPTAEEAASGWTGGGMDQLIFSNLQIALGRPTGGTDGSGASAALLAGSAQAQEADSADMLSNALGLETASEEEGHTGYSDAQRYELRRQLQQQDGGAGSSAASTAPSSELLILTQGTFQELTEYPQSDGTTIIAPAQEGDRSTKPADVGIYAISYGKGEQQVGNAYIQFAYDQFTADTELYAMVTFANVGDASIRGSNSPVTVKLMLNMGEDGTQTMAEWKIYDTITAGQTVRLTTSDQLCAALTRDLGDGDFFYLTVEEDETYITQTGGTAYSYNSSAVAKDDPGYYVYLLEDKPELGVENFTGRISGVEQDGRIAVDISFDVTNRGDAVAEDAFLQITYLKEYKADGEPVYDYLDISDSDLDISQEQVITQGIMLMAAPTTDEKEIGVLLLDTDSTYYTDDYYITAARYNEILGQYYSTTEKNGWTQGKYNGLDIWYDKNYYNSAYAAYTAGQEAVEHWVYDSGSGNYYSDEYGSYTEAKTAADDARKAEYFLTQAQYDALSASEQEKWKEAGADHPDTYIPVSYETYEAAEAAYQAALGETEARIRQNYLRTVEGTIYVDSVHFNGSETGSLNLRVEVFSSTSNADFKANIYSSDHSDEYYAVNNRGEIQLEQATFVSAADRVVLGQNGTHRLPVTIRTTTGQAPVIRVLEVEDGAEELGQLYFTPGTDSDGNPATVTGYLTVVGNVQGQGVIHIVDEATNTTYPIVYRVDASGDGINIFNDDAQFTFYNADGDPYNPDETGQDWDFRPQGEWADDLRATYLSNLSVGQEGASFTFETQGNTFVFELIGDATVTSSRFAGEWHISGTGADPEAQTVDFGETNGVTHTVTVTITSKEAHFDVVRVGYPQGYTPSDDANAPGIYFDRSFPAAGSVAEGESVTITAYAVDDSGLQSLTLSGDAAAADGSQPEQLADGLWSYTFTVTQNGSFTVAAQDTSGNRTGRTVSVDWFTDGEPQGEDEAPNLEASVWKVVPGGTDVDLFDPENKDEVITAGESEDGVTGQIRVTVPDSGINVTYSSFNSGTAQFEETSSGSLTATITRNGYYMVQVDEPNFGTWRREIFYVDRFAPMPRVDLSQSQDGLSINWSASKDEESVAPLASVMLNNGIDLLDGTSALSTANYYTGSFPIRYGGEYTVTATDTQNVSGTQTIDVEVPVQLDETDISTVDPWGQPDDSGARYGSVTIDFTNVTGGDYVAESAKGGLADYYGSYQYLVIPKEEYEGYTLTEDQPSDLSERTDWRDAAHDAAVTWENLQADEDGTEYVLLVRDKQNPTEYSTMAEYEFKLTDNAIDCTSISASLASTPGAKDARVYVAADKGATGYYEFAILPLLKDEDASTEEETVYKDRTAAEFQDPSVEWIPADGAGLNTGTLEELPEGPYQVAIRALYADADDVQAAAAKGQAAQDAADALEALIAQRDSAASGMARNILTYSNLLEEKEIALAEIEADSEATDAEKEAAQDEVDKARADYEAALTSLAQEDKDEIAALRDAWKALEEGDDKDAARDDFEAAITEACQTYQEGRYASNISTAQTTADSTQADYETALAGLTTASAQKYTADPTLWDGLLTNANMQVTIRSGEGSALKATPSVASGSDENDGSIQVTAEGGSAYDGGDTVHYQFAILPLEDQESAVDYTKDMTAIGELNLDWQFADDTLEAPDQILFDQLLPGWYQVFVRVVYDPDPSDNYDLNTYLSDDSAAGLSALRAAYEAAQAAAETAAVDAAADQAHSLYLAWQALEDGEEKTAAETALRDALGGTKTEQNAIIALANTWQNTPEENAEAKAEAYDDYREALHTHLNDLAQAAYIAAGNAYLPLRDELAAQVDQAYAATPGYYDTASFTEACVGVASSGQPSRIISVEQGDGEVTYTLRPGELSTQDKTRIFNSSRDQVVHLLREEVHIVVPVGALENYREVGTLLDSYLGGSGNVVEYTPEEGEPILMAFSLVEEDLVSYLYLGRGEYRVVEHYGSFDDIAGHWAEDSILFTAHREVFRGMGDGLFHSGEVMTRAMAVTMLHRMAGEPESSAEIPFTDVSGDAWYADALRWAYETGVVNGVSATRFAPEDPMTREQLVTLLHRFLTLLGFPCEERAELDGFADSADVAGFAAEAFRWAVAAGVVDGRDGRRLAPQEDASRAEIAAVCERIVRFILE